MEGVARLDIGQPLTEREEIRPKTADRLEALNHTLWIVNLREPVLRGGRVYRGLRKRAVSQLVVHRLSGRARGRNSFQFFL